MDITSQPSPEAVAGAGPGERLVELRTSARAQRLRLIRQVVGDIARSCGCGRECVRDIVIAVDEACQNVIRHAYHGDPQGEIVLEMFRRGDEIEVRLMDFAAPVDVEQIKPRSLDELRPGGLGTHFITECMDRAEFCPPPSGVGNCLSMRKRIR